MRNSSVYVALKLINTLCVVYDIFSSENWNGIIIKIVVIDVVVIIIIITLLLDLAKEMTPILTEDV